jgi:signal transduction histidine kinase
MPAHDAKGRRPRSGRVTRDDEFHGTGEDQRARLVELERDRAAMEVFARVAAHELREPLIVTETLARLIKERLRDRADGNTRSDLDSLVHAVSRMRLLVETVLLDASSLGQPLERRPVSLERLVRDSIELLQREIRARDARILAEDLPVVQGDGVMLGAVVTNLLMNALRYGPRKDGEVRVEARRERAHWRISVISQGPTISKEDRARIFERYHRSTHERRVAGAGLGLAICRSFVERHDGVIGVAPVRAGGNRFYFTIPAIERSTEKASITPPG